MKQLVILDTIELTISDASYERITWQFNAH